MEEARRVLGTVRSSEGEDEVRMEFEDMRRETEGEKRGTGIGEAAEWKMLYATPGNRKRLLLSVVIGVSTQWVRYFILGVDNVWCGCLALSPQVLHPQTDNAGQSHETKNT